MNRREATLSLIALGSAPLTMTHAQEGARSRVVGYLSSHPEPPRPDGRGVVTGELEDLGWREGRNLRIERAIGSGREDQLPALAADLVQKKVDVIVTIGPEATVAAARATTTIPIVFWGVGLPVEQGVVDSLARPGRNATGYAWAALMNVSAKQLELLKETVPGLTRIAWIEAPDSIRTVSGQDFIQPRLQLRDIGRGLGLEIIEHVVQRSEDFDVVFGRILASRVRGLAVRPNNLTWRERKRIADFALRNRLPSSYGERDYVEAGGLISYGINWRSTIPPTVAYIDRVLRGAKPSELPVELPSRYEVAVNLRTAAALGVMIPQSVMLRAERVIE